MIVFISINYLLSNILWMNNVWIKYKIELKVHWSLFGWFNFSKTNFFQKDMRTAINLIWMVFCPMTPINICFQHPQSHMTFFNLNRNVVYLCKTFMSFQNICQFLSFKSFFFHNTFTPKCMQNFKNQTEFAVYLTQSCFFYLIFIKNIWNAIYD